MQAGHVTVSPLEAFNYLHNLWLSPVAVIPGALQSILKQVLAADPCLGLVYFSKVDLVDTYMRLLVRMEDVPSFALLISKKNPSNTQLMGFHLSLPMEYVDNAPYFCMATETVEDLTNKAIYQREQEHEHTLEMASKARATDDSGAPKSQADASWEHFLVE